MAWVSRLQRLIEHQDPSLVDVIRLSFDPRSNHHREAMTGELCAIIREIEGQDITLSQFTPAIIAEMRARILNRPELVQLVEIQRAKIGRQLSPGEVEEIRDRMLQKTKAAPVKRRLQWLENLECFVERIRKNREAREVVGSDQK